MKMRMIPAVAGLLFAWAAFAGLPATAGEVSDAQKTTDEQNKKIEDLLKRIKALEDAKRTEPTQPTPPKEGKLFTVVSTVPVQFYGLIKLDSAYDSSRVSTGNYARWVEPQRDNEGDDEFNMTANATRLGFKVGSPEGTGAMKPSGLVEVDFYGNGAAENKPDIMMRHAYLKLDWPDYDFSALAGQTSDVISPLNPSTLNYTVMWWQGNIGYRRPQLRLTKGFDLEAGPLQRVEFQAAATRDIGRRTGFDPGDSGEDSGLPGLQWRGALSLSLLTKKPTVLGVWGHWAREEYDTDAQGHGQDFDSGSTGVDLTLPLTPWLAIQAEAWEGQDLDAYLGGIGQGINTTDMRAIRSVGGWAAATVTPFPSAGPEAPGAFLRRFAFNLGAGVDDPDNNDLTPSDRLRNLTYFANAIYDLGSGASVGLEYARLETQYRDQNDSTANRVQLSVMYKF